MKIKPEQLRQQLGKQVQPIYLITGDEPLLVNEACQQVRDGVKAQGFDERLRFQVETGFNWQHFLNEAGNRSLFSAKKLLELHLVNPKIGDKGRDALLRYIDEYSDDNVLLLSSNRLDSSSQKTKWFKAVEAIGVVVGIWPIERSQFPHWIKQRLKSAGLATDTDGINTLCENTEGNLLAAQQAIEKLRLLYRQGFIAADKISHSLADQTRFDLFKLVDAALAKETNRVVNILQHLRQEGVEPILILWALTREIRSLAAMAWQVERGNTIDSVLTTFRVLYKRKAFVKRALQAHSADHWWILIDDACQIDHAIKGFGSDDTWLALQQLALALAEVKYLAKPA